MAVKKRISVSAAKAKGRRLQQWACEQISKLVGIEWGSEDDKLIQSRPMGQQGTDVILRGDAAIKFPFSVECKNQEKWNLNAYIEQAKNNQNKKDWLLILKKNNIHPIVVMDAEVFFKMMAKND